MAGDWIAWVKGLRTRREVILMASALDMTQREVASCCMEWWEWCDSEGDFDPSRDCHVRGVTFVTGLSQIDAHVGVTGFGQAMADVGWAVANDDGDLMHPQLGRWTGSAAKERLRANKRQQKRRKSVTKKSRSKRDKNVTREEKRRVSTNVDTPPKVPLDEIDFPAGMDTSEVRKSIDKWLAYKRGRGQTYKKPAQQISLLLKEFKTPGDFTDAVDMAMARNWAGCFPPKSGGNRSKVGAGQRHPSDQSQEEGLF